MRLLYLAYRFPYPPDKGERIRAFHQIRTLGAQAGIEVHLVCPVVEAPPPKDLAAMREHCASIELVKDSKRAMLAREAARLLAGAPRMTGTYDSRALRRAVEAAAAKHDVDCVLVSTLHVADSARRARNGHGAALVVDLIDVYSQLWLDVSRFAPLPAALLGRLEGRRLSRYEAALAAAADAIVVCSEAEAQLWRRTSDVPAAVVRNGVDLEYFAPAVRSGAPPPIAHEPTIVFTGQMDYLPNVDAVRFFCSDVLPALRRRHPTVRFMIVGRHPTRAVRALESAPGVQVVGEVSDVRPYLARAAAAVAPLRVARGVQNKVLEAMAMGVPVVATSAALGGLDRDCGDGACRADDPAAFASELDRLLSDAQRRARCASAARDYVERRHRWDHEALRLRDVLEAARARRAGARDAASAPVRSAASSPESQALRPTAAAPVAEGAGTLPAAGAVRGRGAHDA